jgi:hypothetical protein
MGKSGTNVHGKVGNKTSGNICKGDLGLEASLISYRLLIYVKFSSTYVHYVKIEIFFISSTTNALILLNFLNYLSVHTLQQKIHLIFM